MSSPHKLESAPAGAVPSRHSRAPEPRLRLEKTKMRNEPAQPEQKEALHTCENGFDPTADRRGNAAMDRHPAGSQPAPPDMPNEPNPIPGHGRLDPLESGSAA